MTEQLSPEQPGNIEKFKISSNFTEYAVDLSGGLVDFYYYESVLSNSVTATATIMETGFQLDDKGTAETAQGTVDGLPIRGGERTDIEMVFKQFFGSLANIQHFVKAFHSFFIKPIKYLFCTKRFNSAARFFIFFKPVDKILTRPVF